MSAVIALGCGLVGRFVIERLLENGHKVVVLDLNIPEDLKANEGIDARQGDVFENINQISPKSVVINMLPGRIGDKVRPVLLKAGHHVVDLAFTAEDPQQHHLLAVQNNAVLLPLNGSPSAPPATTRHFICVACFVRCGLNYGCSASPVRLEFCVCVCR